MDIRKQPVVYTIVFPRTSKIYKKGLYMIVIRKALNGPNNFIMIKYSPDKTVIGKRIINKEQLSFLINDIKKNFAFQPAKPIITQTAAARKKFKIKVYRLVCRKKCKSKRDKKNKK